MIIYSLTNKFNGKVYVGQTIHSVDDRVNQHVYVSGRGSKYPIHCAIRKHGIDAFNVSVIQECFTHEELDLAEIDWIARLNARTDGYNLSEGGSGVKGKGIWNHTDEAKSKIGKGNRGKVRSPEVRTKISESVKKTMTEQMKNLISERTKEALADPVRRDHMRKSVWDKTSKLYADPEFRKLHASSWKRVSKIVQQFTLTGEFIAEYCSAKEASKSTGVNHGNLCNCCRGVKKHAGGFVWRYLNNESS